MGAFAEYVAVPEDVLALMSTSLDFETAAAVPLAGLTALQALRDELNLGVGSKVFISGAAGRVGTFAIQIAKWLGAYVVTTASPGGHDLVQGLGVDEAVDYTVQSPSTGFATWTACSIWSAETPWTSRLAW